MKSKSTIYLTCCLVVFLSAVSNARSSEESEMVSVEWKDAAQYSDVRASYGYSRENFEKHVFEILGDYIKSEAKKALKQGRLLDVKVLDLDMAGHVRMDYVRRGAPMRVIKETYPPMIDIEYTIKDISGKLICTGRDKLTDSIFLGLGARPLQSENLYYEKRLVRKWIDNVVKRNDCE
jgi:hypothetical protein